MQELTSESKLKAPSQPPEFAASRLSLHSGAINLEIEYLRAIAILLIVTLHAAPFLELKPLNYIGAHTGVDLFFCISGYVIYRSFQPFLDRHRYDGQWWTAARAFWVRRIFRLVPSAWLWLSISIACSWAFNRSGWFNDFEGNLKSAIYIVANVANLAYANGTLGGNAQYWSLALEDQFYFVFPFFLFFFRGSWRWGILIALIVVQALPNRLFTANPYLWATRLDALMWGCLISQFFGSAAYWKLEPKFCRHRIVALIANGGLIFLLIAVPHLPYFVPTFRVESTVALASAGLVFLASFERGYVLPLSRTVKAALAWIGSRSYGIYLIHIPLYGVIKDIGLRYSEFMGQGSLGAGGTAIAAVMAIVLLPTLAELNFRFIETPLRRKGKLLAQRIILAKHGAAVPSLAQRQFADADILR